MSFDKTAIEEANKHLLAMNKRVVELGAMLNEKTVRLENIDKENQAKIEAIVRQKDAEIEKSSTWLESTQAEIRRLKTEMTQKDNEINQLRLKAAILEKVSRFRPELTALLNCLNEFNSVPVSVPQPTLTNQSSATITNGKIVTNDQYSDDKSNGKLEMTSAPQTILTNLPSATITNELIATNDQHSGAKSNAKPSVSSAESEDAAQPEVMKHRTIVWTPKDRSIVHGDNPQSNGSNQKSNFQSKIPGAAIKHDHDVTESNDSCERDQTHYSDSDNLDAHVMNYETQL